MKDSNFTMDNLGIFAPYINQNFSYSSSYCIKPAVLHGLPNGCLTKRIKVEVLTSGQNISLIAMMHALTAVSVSQYPESSSSTTEDQITKTVVMANCVQPTLRTIVPRVFDLLQHKMRDSPMWKNYQKLFAGTRPCNEWPVAKTYVITRTTTVTESPLKKHSLEKLNKSGLEDLHYYLKLWKSRLHSKQLNTEIQNFLFKLRQLEDNLNFCLRHLINNPRQLKIVQESTDIGLLKRFAQTLNLLITLLGLKLYG